MHGETVKFIGYAVFGTVIHYITRDLFFSSGSDLEGCLLWHVTFSRLGRCSNLQTNYDDDRRMCLYYVRRQALPYMKSQVIKDLKKIFIHVKICLLLLELLCLYTVHLFKVFQQRLLQLRSCGFV